MFTIISAIIGFAGGFLPDILKYFKQKQDNQHELAILDKQIDAQKQLHTQRIEEINVQADIRESEALYKSAEIKETGVKWADAFLAIYNGLVRPTITYAFVGLYIAVKIAQFYSMYMQKIPWDKAMMLMWTEFDASVLMLVLSYYFGARQANRVFKLK